MPVGRIRAPGAGRKLVFHHYPSLDQAFLSIVDAYIAGDPCNEKIRWVRLTNAQIKKTLKKAGYCVGKNMVRNLLKKHGFVKRKMQRKKPVAVMRNVMSSLIIWLFFKIYGYIMALAACQAGDTKLFQHI